MTNVRSLRTEFRSSNARLLQCAFAAIPLRALERAPQMRLRLSPLGTRSVTKLRQGLVSLCSVAQDILPERSCLSYQQRCRSG